MKAPKLPAELFSKGREFERHARRVERAQIMRARFGVEFSIASTNPLGVAATKKLGIKGAGLPRAIYTPLPFINDFPTVNKVKDAFFRLKKVTDTPYQSFTHLAFEADVDFKTLFGVIHYLHSQDPYAVTFAVDRLGKNTAVKLR